MAESFHEQLLMFLQGDLQRKKIDGWDESLDPELSTYRDLLSRSIRSLGPLPLQEIAERYQHLFCDRGPVHLEHKILEAFSEKEMKQLETPPLKMTRGLPRLYRRDDPAVFRVKPNFSHLPSLKKAAAAKAVYAQYRNQTLPADAKVTILTQVLPDGQGDLQAALEAARVIKRHCSFIDLELFFLTEAPLPVTEQLIARWEGTESQIQRLRSSDLVLQIPTRSSQIEELQKTIQGPKWESIGEFGFLESSWYHPGTHAHSMGLHFLEKGLLVRETLPSGEISNEWLKTKLKSANRFFLAYLYSQSGIYIYLHALLKSLESDRLEIDLCVPDGARWLAYFDQRLKSGKTPLDKSYGIGRIELHVGSSFAVQKISEAPKTLRILCPTDLSGLDFQRLISRSSGFVGCRGNQSFAEVISANKGFFYDARPHSRYFLKDLLALAENKIGMHRSTLGVLHLTMKLLESELPEESSEWVDELTLQREEKIDLLQTAEELGELLKNPDTFIGFKKLAKILCSEYSCNEFLIQMVQRAICHSRRPEIAKIEEQQLSLFASSQQSLTMLIENLRKQLSI